MKTLILCVDRDDDLGHKAGVETPVVGRRRVQDAATRMGCADPEDSDVNALFAAVNLYDRELKAAASGDRQVEVAAIAGHRIVGLRSDRVLARQLEEVLELTRADEVVLVSDGAEDEQILPLLSSRVKVAHVHRSIVKQAPRLEGFYHVLMRMLDDDKLAKRYVLPMGIILLIWGVFIWRGWHFQALALTLALAGIWLIIHALHWEDRVTGFFQEFAESARTGKITFVTDTVMVLLIVIGGYLAWQTAEGPGPTLHALTFTQGFLLYFVSGLIVHSLGRLIHAWVRSGTAHLGHFTVLVALIAFGFIGSVAVDLAIEMHQGAPLTKLLTFDLLVRLLTGLVIAVSGALVVNHLRKFHEQGPQPRAR